MSGPSKDASVFSSLAVVVGGFAGRNSKLVLGLVLVLTCILAPFLQQVEYDDDILKFLPEESSRVQQFQEIGSRFQGLSIAMLGVEVPDGDLFTVERMRALQGLTESLKTVEGVAFSSSITALQDIEVKRTDEEEVNVVTDLVSELPESADAPGAADVMNALEAKVLSRDHVVGALISKAGDAALVVCYLEPGAILKDVADAIRVHTDNYLGKSNPGLTIHYGGAPFVGSYIVHSTRRDIVRLSLISGAAIIFILILTARSLAGSVIALSSVGLGIIWVIGLMGLLKQPLTLVSSSLPMLLLALGSAYSIHILVRVFGELDGGAKDRLEAVTAAVSDVGPPIFIAGLTSALAFLSFVAMDIEPMRNFGVWMFAGTLIIVLLALLVVPAACVLIPLHVREGGRTPGWALRLMVGSATGVVQRPVISGVILVAILSASYVYMGAGKAHMTMRDFFLEGSEPVRAEDFLEEHLGGSVFMQIQVTGDIKSPSVLREIDRLALFAAGQQGVTNVQSVVDPMLLAGEALFGDARIPGNVETTRAIATLAEGEGDPNMRLIVDNDWKHALIHVKVRGENIEEALELSRRLETMTDASWSHERVLVERSELDAAARELERTEVFGQLAMVMRKAGQDVGIDDIKGVMDARYPLPEAAILRGDVERILTRDIREDEMIYLRDGADFGSAVDASVELLASGKLTLDGLYEVMAKIASDEDLDEPEGLRESVDYIHGNLDAVGRRYALGGQVDALVALMSGDVPKSVRAGLNRAAASLLDSLAAVPAAAAGDAEVVERQKLSLDVTGTPLVYEGMNLSVQKNQEQSLMISMTLVFLALAMFFRRLGVALVASVPAGFTLLVTFGLMGAFNIPMDVGTSMMTSIALGIGIDYAVHFIWHYGTPSADEEPEVLASSMKATGWGIVINALEVAIGFGLLALGNIVPMRNVGLLTASAMVVSALATLILIPGLLRWFGPIFSLRSSTS